MKAWRDGWPRLILSGEKDDVITDLTRAVRAAQVSGRGISRMTTRRGWSGREGREVGTGQGGGRGAGERSRGGALTDGGRAAVGKGVLMSACFVCGEECD